MLRLMLCIVALYCGNSKAQTPPDPELVVYDCSENEATYGVKNGVKGGITFVEGTPSASPTCNTTLQGLAEQNFTMHFTQCDVQPGSITNTTAMTISFVVIVQAKDYVYIEKDKRWKVTCTFTETTKSIDTQLTGSSTGLAYDTFSHETIPKPTLALYYWDGNAAQVNNELVKLGRDLNLVITLEEQIPSYFIIAKECSVFAMNVAGIQIGGSTNQILIIDQGCPKYPDIFGQFTYGMVQEKDSAGALFDVPKLNSNFSVFTPYLSSTKLTEQSITIKFTCRVRVCVSKVSDCVKPVCPPPAAVRRRRQAEDNDSSNTSTMFDLHDNIRINLFTDESISEEPTTVHLGENNLCMDKLAFWGALLTLLALLVAAWIALCCFFIFVRHRRRRECRTLIYEDIQNKSSSKDSIITPVEVNVVEKPMKTVPFVLPRYHAADFAVETVERTVEVQ